MKLFRILALVFALVGLGMSIAAVYSYVERRDWLRTAQTAIGTVVENVLIPAQRARPGGNANPDAWAPRLQFVASDGKQVSFTSSSSSRPAEYALGDKVEVIYSGSNPSDATIHSFETIWGSTAMFAGLGFVFIILGASNGIALMISGRRSPIARSG